MTDPARPPAYAGPTAWQIWPRFLVSSRLSCRAAPWCAPDRSGRAGPRRLRTSRRWARRVPPSEANLVDSETMRPRRSRLLDSWLLNRQRPRGSSALHLRWWLRRPTLEPGFDLDIPIAPLRHNTVRHNHEVRFDTHAVGQSSGVIGRYRHPHVRAAVSDPVLLDRPRVEYAFRLSEVELGGRRRNSDHNPGHFIHRRSPGHCVCVFFLSAGKVGDTGIASTASPHQAILNEDPNDEDHTRREFAESAATAKSVVGHAACFGTRRARRPPGRSLEPVRKVGF